MGRSGVKFSIWFDGWIFFDELLLGADLIGWMDTVDPSQSCVDERSDVLCGSN